MCIHLTQPASAPSRSSPSPPPCPLLRRGSGQPDDQSGSPTMGVCRSRAASWILPRRDRPPCLSPTLGPHDEDTACWERTRRRSRGVLVPMFGGKNNGTRFAEKATRPPMCAPRGQGRCPRTVARSQVPEDYTKSPRRRARSKIVLARRGRLVSRSGENKGNSAMCEPSTLYRAVGSRPTHRQRSARTSSPRRDRTARASEGM